MQNWLIRKLEYFLVGMFFFLVSIRSFIFWSLYPDTKSISGDAWVEVLIWLCVLLLGGYLAQENDLWRACLSQAQRFPVVWLFALYAVLSIFWSSSWTVTAHRSLVFLFSLLLIVYETTRYSLEEFLDILFWLGIIVVLSSLVMVFVVPVLGRDFNPPYNGAWRGLFWHKNHLGNIVPIFILVFLEKIFIQNEKKVSSLRMLAIAFYFLSLLTVFFSKSASGYILVVLIHFMFAVVVVWLKVKHRLRPIHYYLVLGFFVFVGIILLLNLDFVLGFFGRDSSFTGRVPLWTILVKNVFPQRPWLGYGFGTIWADSVFRHHMRDLLGWPYSVLIGDNGFLDLLLNLGVVGFGIFLINYLTAWLFSVRLVYKLKTLIGAMPFMFMVYTFFANLTFSLFMETEVFVWSLIVIFWFISAKSLSDM